MITSIFALLHSKKSFIYISLFQAMLLSKELIHDFSLEEANLREEWKQSYDDLENANDWIGLNCKRKLEKLLEIHLKEFHRLRVLFQPIYEARVAADNERKAAETSYTAAIAMFDTCIKEVAPAGAAQFGLKAVAHDAVSSLLSTFNMPFKRKPPQRRRLQVVPYSLVFVRDPLERVRRQFRAAFVLLDQRVLGLRPGTILFYDHILLLVLIISQSTFIVRCEKDVG